MRDAQASTVYLKDYQAPAFFIDETHLSFYLYDDHARVESRLCVRRNQANNTKFLGHDIS